MIRTVFRIYENATIKELTNCYINVYREMHGENSTVFENDLITCTPGANLKYNFSLNAKIGVYLLPYLDGVLVVSNYNNGAGIYDLGRLLQHEQASANSIKTLYGHDSFRVSKGRLLGMVKNKADEMGVEL